LTAGKRTAHKGEHDTAIADFTEAIRLEPDAAEAYYNWGDRNHPSPPCSDDPDSSLFSKLWLC